MRKKILAICGSTRKQSVNSLILENIAEKYAREASFDLYFGISNLPHFDTDLDQVPLPPPVTDLRQRIAAADAVLICTPEYVFSLPGSFKNAIEWTVSTTLFTDKQVALITASSSGHKAHESLQLVMRTLGARWGEKGTLLISAPKIKINTAGEFTDEATLQAVTALMNELLNEPVPQQSAHP